MNTRRLYFVHAVFMILPPSRCYGLKRALMQWAGARVGVNVRIVSTARFHMTGELVIGDSSYIGDYALIAGGDAPVTIGRHVAIGPRCLLVTGTHELYTEQGIAAGRGLSLPISVGDGAWLGAASTVLGGVSIGAGAVLAAGAVVHSSVPDRQRVGGVPARPLAVVHEEAGG